MKIDVKDYKSFEQLSSDIRQLNKKWKDSTARADKKLTFAGIQKQMQTSYVFITNERKYLNEDINKLRELWSSKVIAKQREKLVNQFNDMVNSIIEATKQDVATLTSSKMEKIGEMLTTAPTEEQLRLLSALQMRGDVDSAEVYHILPVFFENYQSMRVLQAIGEQNGIVLHLPVQLDCREMFNTLNEASDYLLGACEELSKKWDNMDIKYHAFFTVNAREQDKQYDPVYQRYIDLFDSTPQLQEVKTEKQQLSKGELARINWYMREVKGLDITNPADHITIALKVENVIKEHPDMRELFLLSEYKDMVTDISQPLDNEVEKTE